MASSVMERIRCDANTVRTLNMHEVIRDSFPFSPIIAVVFLLL